MEDSHDKDDELCIEINVKLIQRAIHCEFFDSTGLGEKQDVNRVGIVLKRIGCRDMEEMGYFGGVDGRQSVSSRNRSRCDGGDVKRYCDKNV